MDKNKHNDKGLGPILSNLPKHNCFRVPKGYFDRLHQSIALRVEMEEKPFADVLDALKNKAAFALPTNYFDSLSERIAAKTTTEQSILDTLPKHEGFAVPHGYFETLYVNIADRVSAENTPARPWWLPAPALRPVLAFAAVAAVAVVVAWPYFTGSGTKTILADNTPKTVKEEPKVIATEPANNTIALPPVVAKDSKKQPVKHVIKPAKTSNVASATDVYDYTGGDFNTEYLLSDVPSYEKAGDNELMEIISEENIDIADLVNSGI